MKNFWGSYDDRAQEEIEEEQRAARMRIEQEERDRIEAWQKILANPGAVVTEVPKNVLRALPKMVASLSKSIAIGAEGIETLAKRDDWIGSVFKPLTDEDRKSVV